MNVAGFYLVIREWFLPEAVVLQEPIDEDHSSSARRRRYPNRSLKLG